MKTNILIDNKETIKIPFQISSYLKEHFRGNVQTAIETSASKTGKIIYNIHVSNEDAIYRMKFNSKGNLIEKEMEPLLEVENERNGIID